LKIVYHLAKLEAKVHRESKRVSP